ncbi:metallophosphoesterase [Bacteroides fragilis]|jgi:UDP-2,3-diacylglucosamine pyrophosphatase LpxH|uniref:metallophosphoesterase n=1 Tax=Bacteroides fragilis TaxID=817 RepID=UPI00044BBB8B|nr:metallophosphoesterase [Bacteroides fragilis]EXZ90195.1 calcineurin-like phosphoesterase family protein [Bacteroides fragilis str. J38-1]
MNLNDNYIFTLSFPEAKSIVASGDIHGDFIQLVFKLCVQYQMKDTILIVAGDCGFGFEKKESYENMVKQNVKRMNEANNWIVFIRGNHDNPAYFDGYTFKYKRFIAIPDYTILQARSHTVLCVGGGISIDRQYRLQAWEKKQVRSVSESSTDKLARNVYRSTEAPVFDKEKMVTISAKYTVDAAITHTAPSFC